VRLCSPVPLQVHRIARTRHVVQRVALHAQPFLSRSVNWFGANRKGETGNPAIAVTSDPARLAALDEHLMGVLKDGMEMLKSAIHMGEGKPFHGSPSLDDVNKVRWEPCYLIHAHLQKTLTLLDRYPTRMKSLVSLIYIDCFP
jgi:hypothetical protein